MGGIGIKIDHLGNKFNSQKEMCKYWGIPSGTFRYNLSIGRSLEESLTIQTNNECKDHLGNKFSSKNQMCKHYGLAMHTLKNRLNKGWSLEKALTIKQNDIDDKKVECEDHLGNKFKYKTEMCRSYGINIATLNSRLEHGHSLEESLTAGYRFDNCSIEDHEGNRFDSIKDLCDFYGIDVSTFYKRSHRGWSIEDIITKRERNYYVEDFEGNQFKNLKEMCDFHGYSYSTVKGRLKRGWSIERAISEPLQSDSRVIWVNGVRLIREVYSDNSEVFYLCSNKGQEEVMSIKEIENL